MAAARRLRARTAVLCGALAVKGGGAAGRREAEPGGHPGGAVSDAGLRLCRWLARCLALRSGGASAVPRGPELPGLGEEAREEEEPERPGAPPKEEVALTVASHRRRPAALPCALAAGPPRPPPGLRPRPKGPGGSGSAPPAEALQAGVWLHSKEREPGTPRSLVPPGTSERLLFENAESFIRFSYFCHLSRQALTNRTL